MKRIQVDFSTMTSEPIDRVKCGTREEREEREELPRLGLQEGERVLLFDGEGLEGEATLTRTKTGAWMANPDPTTWRDTVPQAYPLPPLGEQERVG
jgi:hypothetical protein